MLKYFGKDYDKDKYLKHGKYYRLMNKYLREKPQGSRINRIKMYEAEKKRNGVSPVAKEVIRKTGPGRSKNDAIVIDGSINMKVMEREQEEMQQTEEERAEKALALYMERAKVENLRQKRGFGRIGKPNYGIDRKRQFATNVLDYLAINKGEPSDPKKWTHTRKNGKEITILNDENEEYSSSSDVDISDYRKSYTGKKRKKKDNTKLPLTENDEE
jgi:hypothetical protein